jgi:pyrroline-5-carboxylate reductase
MKITIIGAGNMGVTFAQALKNSHIVNNENICLLENSDSKIEDLKNKGFSKIYSKAFDCVPDANLIILCVKPQDFEKLSIEIKPFLRREQVVLSIMAGIRIDSLQASLGVKKIVRSMPNLPCVNGQGMTVYTASEEVSELERMLIGNLLNTTGKSLLVSNERLIDASTALSGSGPAYVFYFMEAMIKKAGELGFSEYESQLLVYQTFEGAVNLAFKSDLSCQEWIGKVSSRGGTTERAVLSMDQNELSRKIGDAVKAAYERAIELGNPDRFGE